MATPQESITTVNGRRCTRSRARTLVAPVVTSEVPAVVAPTDVALSTPVAEAPQVQSSAAEAAPPPPASSSSAAAAPISSAPAEQPVAAPAPTPVLTSSAAGTLSASSPLSRVPNIPPNFAAIAPSGPRAAGPNVEVEQPSRPTGGPSQAAAVVTDAPLAPAPSSSDTSLTAVLSPSPDRSTSQAPSFTGPGAAASAILPSSVVGPGQSSQVEIPAESTILDTAGTAQQQPTTTPASAFPSSDTSSGVIGPEAGGSDSEGGLTIPSNGDANIGSIVGGVIGGVAGLALVCALLFYCLRKRKTTQPRWAEKQAQGPRLVEKARGIPAGISVIFAKIKGMKAGPSRNPYRRHHQQDSIGSIYSTTNGPDGFYAAGAPVRRSSSRRSERNRLRKKNGSISSQMTIPERKEEDVFNLFDDPEPPRVLRLSNPDSNQSPRGPLTPQPAVTQTNPFDTPFDDPAVPPGWPEALPSAIGHKRTPSALSSHHPSSMFSGPNTLAKGSFGPPASTPATAPPSQRRSSMALPTFDATSTGASRISEMTFASSRPNTNLFTPGGRPARTVRQSDPFDLDRPEVLGFGSVVGRKEVRASVTRQAAGRGRRVSSVGNWSNTNEGPYSSFGLPGRR